MGAVLLWHVRVGGVWLEARIPFFGGARLCGTARQRRRVMRQRPQGSHAGASAAAAPLPVRTPRRLPHRHRLPYRHRLAALAAPAALAAAAAAAALAALAALASPAAPASRKHQGHLLRPAPGVQPQPQPREPLGAVRARARVLGGACGGARLVRG